MTAPQPADLLRAGDLGALRQLFAGRVKAEPARAAHRIDLADVLIVLGEYERADTHLSLAADQDTALALPVALTRQLIRAATQRVETFEQRRPPDLVTEADAAVTAALARLAGGADAEDAPGVSAEVNGTPDVQFVDLDDRTPSVLEVLTSTGKYVWVSYADIVGLDIQPPQRLRDIVWRQAELEVRGGPTGIVYLPAIYHAPASEQSDTHRLGRATDWHEEGGSARGIGLRTWMAGDDDLPFDALQTLRIAPGA